MDAMKAKCPYCDFGCENCEDGFFEAQFPDGPIFILECADVECGFASGAQILNPESPPLSKVDIKCILCGADTSWTLFGWSGPDPDTDQRNKEIDQEEDY